MPRWRRLKTFVKGYGFSDEKIGAKFGFDGLSEPDKVDAAVEHIVKNVLEDEAYASLALGYQVDRTGKAVVIIVLDDDDDKERLLKKPLSKPHPSIVRIMEILDGPAVFKPIV